MNIGSGKKILMAELLIHITEIMGVSKTIVVALPQQSLLLVIRKICAKGPWMPRRSENMVLSGNRENLGPKSLREVEEQLLDQFRNPLCPFSRMR
ncbi:MAG: hypothetical protein ACLQPD_19295 [Desulfomonilaceae bacterium]